MVLVPVSNTNGQYVVSIQRRYWSMRTTWWTFVSSLVYLIPTGCQTS